MSTPVSDPVEREIRQIIPASGYAALFFDEDNGEAWADSLVGWALVAESNSEPVHQRTPSLVLGLVADGKAIVFADEFPNFVGYLSPEGALDDWRDEVSKAWEEQKSQKGERGKGAPRGEDLPRALQRKKTWFDEA